MSAALPEPGQLVEVRRRQWVVMDIAASSLPGATVNRPQHLVTLASIDEDSLDETLAAVWEIEPGARVLESAGLPAVDGWDPPERISAFLDAVRWGAATSADHMLLQAPFRSGIEIQDHQLDPLVRALGMSRTSLLIADDVGLGKTIEAGLVVQELLIRHRARSVLIVCPASLQVKWKDEMWEKFGLDFRIVNTEYVKTLRRERGLHANPWTSFPRLITSMDWMKAGEGLRLMKDVLPPHLSFPRKFDVLIVDEAHNVAPSAASHYPMPSQRTQLIRRVAPHFQHRMFLTATPHNGYQESFTALLELLDDQRFARTVEPDPAQLQRVMVRRLKTDLVDKNGKRIYPDRAILPLSVEYTADEREAHRLLTAYTESRSASVKGSPSGVGADFIHMLLKKRLFSSPMAFAMTLAKHRSTLAGARKKKSDGMDERILRKAIARCAEDYADDSALERAEAEAVETATEMGLPLTAEQQALLGKLGAWAEGAKNRADSKALAILALLDERLKTKGQLNGKRIILFTEYRATHDWLLEILSSHGWGGELLSKLHGGTDPEERELIKAAFQAHPSVSPVRILLATDAASEGIDLQNHCNYLVHVEIPWNPNVMEQRNGRIDRHGQRQEKVLIWHPVGAGTRMEGDGDRAAGDLLGDHDFLLRAVQKVQNMRQDLGCVGPVIASQIEQAMLGRRRYLDTQGAEQQAAKTKKFVTAERDLNQRIALLHARLVEARTTLHLEPHRIRRTVDVALALAGRAPLKPVSLDGFEGEAFDLPLLTGSWAQALKGVPHPHTGARRPITFDHSAAKGRDDVVLVHLQHKLVQMALRLLRAEVWAPEGRKTLHRVAVRSIPDSVSSVPVVVAWSRLVVTGAGHHRLHEELTMAAGELKDSGFSRVRVLRRIEELLDASEGALPPKRAFVFLQRRFEEQREGLLRAVEARSKERLDSLISALERRQAAEEQDLRGVLDDLEALLRRELADKAPPAQLSMWPTLQQEELRRDEAALKARLARIPSERDDELRAIRRRYAEPAIRTFPVALEFLVPASQLAGGV
jgi:superfamily II DNA or RNA helicase